MLFTTGRNGGMAQQDECNDCRWVFDAELAEKSFAYVARQAPDVDAYLANGMCNFRSGINGQPQRMLHQIPQLETMLGKPVVAHDTALYWRIFKTLGIKPDVESRESDHLTMSSLGQLLGSL